MRKIIGWPFILCGYVIAILVLNFNGVLYTGGKFDFSQFLLMLGIADVAILFGCLVAGARMGRKPTFTNVITAIITWFLIIVLLPYIHMLKTLFGLLKMLFTGKRPASAPRRVNTGKTGGEREVYNRASNICRSYSKRENICSGVTAESRYTPNIFSHLIEIDVDIHFDVDERQITTEYDANVAKTSMQNYASYLPIADIQKAIIAEINSLAQTYEDVAGEWKVAVGRVRNV